MLKRGPEPPRGGLDLPLPAELGGRLRQVGREQSRAAGIEPLTAGAGVDLPLPWALQERLLAIARAVRPPVPEWIGNLRYGLAASLLIAGLIGLLPLSVTAELAPAVGELEHWASTSWSSALEAARQPAATPFFDDARQKLGRGFETSRRLWNAFPLPSTSDDPSPDGEEPAEGDRQPPR